MNFLAKTVSVAMMATMLAAGGAAAATVAGGAADSASETSSVRQNVSSLNSGDAIVRFALESAVQHNGPGVDFSRLGLRVALDQAVNQTLMTDVGVSGLQTAVAVDDGVSSVPIPAALPLFMSALVVLGLISYRRERQAKAN